MINNIAASRMHGGGCACKISARLGGGQDTEAASNAIKSLYDESEVSTCSLRAFLIQYSTDGRAYS